MNKSKFTQFIKEEITSILNEAPTGSIQLNKATPESELKKYIQKGYNVKLSENTLLKQSKLSSSEYQQAKKLKGFNKDEYKWEPSEDLYIKVLNEVEDPIMSQRIAEMVESLDDIKDEYTGAIENDSVWNHIDQAIEELKSMINSPDVLDEAKDDDEEVEDNWGKVDKEDTSMDDDSLDKNAIKGARKINTKVSKLDSVLSGIKQTEKSMKELVNKYKQASGAEKDNLLSQLKAKTKIKKELENLRDKLANKVVK